jgi:hypothetical protein
VSELWDSFTSQLHQYDSHLAEQRTQLQAATARQVEEFKGRLAGFASRCAVGACWEPPTAAGWQVHVCLYFSTRIAARARARPYTQKRLERRRRLLCGICP